jgi:predicted nucleotidyltransferase
MKKKFGDDIDMKNLEELKKIINEHKKELEEKYKVKSIAIFGSYVRNEQNAESDVDILVEFKEPVGLLFIHLADYLEEILGIKVDLLTPEAIKPNRKKYIVEKLIYV